MDIHSIEIISAQAISSMEISGTTQDIRMTSMLLSRESIHIVVSMLSEMFSIDTRISTIREIRILIR